MSDNLQSSDYELVVFSDDWHGLPFSCKHLLKHFAPETPIIWVETIGLRSPGLNLYDIKRAFQKISGWLKKPDRDERPLPKNVRLLDPFQIPYNHFKFVRDINKRNLIKSVNRISRRSPSTRRVILTTWPFLGNLIGCLDEDLSIYYRVDDFSEFPGVRKDYILELEQETIKRSDLIVASAEKLADVENKRGLVKYLPHGVDYEHFASGMERDGSPDPFAGISSPRIGFFGLLNSWLDLELVCEVAKNNPQWSFIMLGPSQLPESELPKADNLYYPGAVPYEALPVQASFFDVALIPFQINKLTLAVNPLKLLEYFALGLPVVSTPLPEVVKYGKQVNIGSDLESLTNAIKNALGSTKEQANQRKSVAEASSWKAKAGELQNWIETALNNK